MTTTGGSRWRSRIPGRATIRSVRDQRFSRTRVVLAAKAGAASLIAWYVAHLIPGADPYAYYAPFGAVLAMTFSIADSVRQSLRAVLAIGIGAAMALISDLVLPETGIAVALMVFLGVLIGGWRLLGSVGSWIPFTALFVLIVGGANPDRYIASYAGLTVLGAVIATAVNLLVPPMPISSFTPLHHRLRIQVADHYRRLARRLDAGTEPADGSAADLVDDRQVLAPLLIELRDATERTVEARRINPRARRHVHGARRQYDHAGRWERLVFLAQETGELVAQGLEADRSGNRMDRSSRQLLSAVLTALATCLEGAADDLTAQRRQLAAAHRALREAQRGLGAEDWLAVGIAVAVRRSQLALMPVAFASVTV